MHSKELLKGTLKTIILKLLADRGRMYGYEITQCVKARSDDQIQITEGALYPTLHKLVADGLLKVETVPMGRRIRKYYQLTEAGQAAAVTQVEAFASFADTMMVLLSLKTNPSL